MSDKYLATQLVIIADDMTGALDAAGPFACRGLRTIFISDVSQVQRALAARPDVLAITTQSREISAAEAMSRVAEVLRALPKSIPLFKKVDSRLKGNIEAELAAFSFARALVIPAIPAFGRNVLKGCITGFGVVEPEPVAARLGRFASVSVIPDIAHDSDISRALAGNKNCDLLVGARGLAEALARDMSGQDASEPCPPLGENLLIVAGTQDPITLAQLALLRARAPAFVDVNAPNGVVELSNESLSGPLMLVQVSQGAQALPGAIVARQLAQSVCVPALHVYGTIVLTGGATAEAVLQKMGVVQMDLIGEALPGLPIVQAGPLTLITKSGGFGSPDTLLKIFELTRRHLAN